MTATPEPYDRDFDFTTPNPDPRQFFAGNRLNSEFNAIAQWTEDLLDFLGGFTRSDGTLAADSVGLDQLTAEALAALNPPVAAQLSAEEALASATAAAASAATSAATAASLLEFAVRAELWSVKDLLGTTGAFLTNNTVTLTATSIVLYNPNTRGTIYYAPGDVTSSVCDITASGANGRDTGSAFVRGETIWFYFIAGPSVPLATVCSRTAPLGTNGSATTGPILPTGYTVYCPAFPFVIGDVNDLTHDTHQNDEAFVVTKPFIGSTSGDGLSTTNEVGGPYQVGWKVHGAGIPEDTFIIQVLGPNFYQLSEDVGTIDAEDMFASIRFPANFKVQDNEVWFKAIIVDDVSTEVPFSPTPAFPWDYSRWVPVGAKKIDVVLDPEIRAADADSPIPGEGLTQSAFIAQWADGNDVVISTYAYIDHDYINANNVGLMFPVSDSRTLNMIYLQGAGSTHSTIAVNFLRHYTF